MYQDEEQIVVRSTPVPASHAANSRSVDIPTPPFRITMELPVFITIMSASLAGTAIGNILLYRTCLHSLNHSKEECVTFLSLDRTNGTEELEKEVQKYVTFVSSVRAVLESVAPAILSLFMAVWSDTHGRKPLVVWPLLGAATCSILQVIYCMWDDLNPWWIILTTLPFSLTGGFIVMFTGAFCYINDITSEKSRSFRMTLIGAAVSLGGIIGGSASSYILRAVGYGYLLLIVATLQVFAYVYTNIWVQESLRGAVQGSVTSVLDFSLIKEMVRECFKRRPNYGRAQILLLTIGGTLSVFITYGLSGLEYLYTREKLHWVLKDMTLFSAANTIISSFGSFFGVVVIQKVFKISDLAFANFAYVSSLVELISKALAVETWHMYLGSFLSMFKGLSGPLIRSLLTKFLPVQDIAKVFALMAALDALCPLIAPVLYNSLYAATIYSLPSSIYVLSMGITAIIIIITGVVQYFRWNTSTTYQRFDEIN